MGERNRGRDTLPMPKNPFNEQIERRKREEGFYWEFRLLRGERSAGTANRHRAGINGSVWRKNSMKGRMEGVKYVRKGKKRNYLIGKLGILAQTYFAAHGRSGGFLIE